jgi:hypothetical protein
VACGHITKENEMELFFFVKKEMCVFVIEENKYVTYYEK